MSPRRYHHWSAPDDGASRCPCGISRTVAGSHHWIYLVDGVERHNPPRGCTTTPPRKPGYRRES